MWLRELEERRVLYPWRVSFSFMIFSEESVLRRFIRVQDYIDGYGLGELSPTDLSDVLSEVSRKPGLKVR